MLQSIIGIILIITGIFDASKYAVQARKIIKVGSAQAQSRKFINFAIMNNIVRITYSIIIMDFYLLLINSLALISMLYLFMITYLYYPYRKRSKPYFKRPSLMLYTINSIIPNKIRKHL
jgi:hypothetical protein